MFTGEPIWILTHGQVVIDCNENYENWQQMWTTTQQDYCCKQFGKGCPPPQHDHVVYHYVGVPVHQPSHIVHVPVPVPSPSHVVYKTRYVHTPPHIIYHHIHEPPPPQPHPFEYDCDQGYSNWYFGWSLHKKSWCCDHEQKGCPGTWHGSFHLHTDVHITHGVGHAHGRIYDCGAGYSNWMQGWSDSKKDWCCDKENKGCVKFHCTGEVAWQHLAVDMFTHNSAELVFGADS